MYLLKLSSKVDSIPVENKKITVSKSSLLTSIDCAEISNGSFSGRIVEVPFFYEMSLDPSLGEYGVAPTGRNGKLLKQNTVIRKDIESNPTVSSNYVIEPSNFWIYNNLINVDYDSNKDLYKVKGIRKWNVNTANFVNDNNTYYVYKKREEIDVYKYPLSQGSILEAYRFSVNPYNIVSNSTKLVNKAVTNSGLSFQYWGNDVTTFDVQGRTLMMRPEENQFYDEILESHPILETQEYKNLKELRRWYMEHNQYKNPIEKPYRIGFYYRGVLYIGFFENFTLTDDAEKPYVMEYSFRFNAYDELDYKGYDFSQFVRGA